MITREKIEDMGRQLDKAGVELDDFLAEAGITRTTWWRWGHGQFQPRMKTWMGVQRAFEKMVPQGDAA